MLKAIKNVGKVITVALGVSVALGLSAHTAQAQTLPLQGKEVGIAFAVVPPFVTVSGNSMDSVSGMEVELILEMQRRTGFKVKDGRYEMMNFGDMIAQTEKGQVDICAGGIYLNESRAKRFKFSAPYFKTSMAVMASKDSGINSFEDLNNKVLSALQGSTATEAIPDNLNIKVTPSYSPTTFMALYDVAVGRSDVAIGDLPVIEDFINNLLGSQMAMRFIVPNSEAEMGMLINKDSPNASALQQAMLDMIADGTAGKIVAKYTNHREANIAQITYERIQKSGKSILDSYRETKITSNALPTTAQ